MSPMCMICRNAYFGQFGQGFYAQPAVVGELIRVRRCRIVKLVDLIPVCECRLLLILQNIFPCPESCTSVVPGVIQDDPHVFGVHLLNQLQKKTICRGPLPCIWIQGVL